MAFKIYEVMWKTIKSDCSVTGQELRAKEIFWSLRKEEKNRFQFEVNRRAHAQWHPDIRMPRLHVSEVHRDIRMIHLWNRFRTAPDSVANCSGQHFNRFRVDGRPIRSWDIRISGSIRIRVNAAVALSPPFFISLLQSPCLREHLYKIWEKSIWYFYHARVQKKDLVERTSEPPNTSEWPLSFHFPCHVFFNF